MYHLIQEFYSHQQEIVDQMNARHKFFMNKPVNIIITDSRCENLNTHIKRVLFKGYVVDDGFICIKWKNIKVDGTEAKLGGVQALFKENSVIITNYSEK